MNKYEQLVEYIINDETVKARELFHQIVVEKSRDIYEGLMADEEDLDEMVGGNEVEDLVDEVMHDEEGLAEEEDEDMEMSFDSEEEDEDGMDHHDDMGGDEELEDRVMDLESALDELKAEFDALMADEAGEEEHDDMDMDSEDDMDMEDELSESSEDEEDDEEDEMDESIVREYVEKVGDTGQKSETGKMSGTGSHTPASGGKNTKSVLASKNDMGGSNVDFTKGSTNNQDGNRPASSPKPKGDLVSNPQNKPGANAGKTAFKTKEAMQGGNEGKLAGADGSRPINKTSVIKSTPR